MIYAKKNKLNLILLPKKKEDAEQNFINNCRKRKLMQLNL
jgi:hypothetical protein